MHDTITVSPKTEWRLVSKVQEYDCCKTPAEQDKQWVGLNSARQYSKEPHFYVIMRLDY